MASTQHPIIPRPTPLKRKDQPTPVPVTDEADILKLTPLGAGQEVGRSCLLMEYKGKTVLLDCGLHPAYSGLAALPFFDNIDPAQIDVLLITHNLSAEDQLYNEHDLLRSYDKIEVVDYHQEVEVEGIRFTPYNAGHVLGAAMFLVEIAGVRILYTGDYSREEDRHLMAAERPANVVPEVLICESTYGVQSHEPRVEREARFTRLVHDVVARGGRCLLPVFALGRAQELLLILDEYWQAHPELHGIPIYYASSLAKKCMTVYQTYTNMMNARIRQQVKVSNPFMFKHISNLKSVGGFEDVGPCVMMASPGMLQNGLSRELLELWCVDKRNGVIIPGYVVEGTLGKQILSQPDEIVSMSGSKLPLRLSVEYISFSAHVDYRENSAFIEQVGAPNLVLVHGDSNEMGRLRSALASRYAEREIGLKIFTPKNCETVELYFRGEKMAKVRVLRKTSVGWERSKRDGTSTPNLDNKNCTIINITPHTRR
ncbi:Cleavage and polyadenylation specificity factor subunit 3 [Borealophlyctis nickersoniae]|nr:Cleavage and polyadenylation specificity factor subunit 3 [Borealophlyctis nickersoniae]